MSEKANSDHKIPKAGSSREVLNTFIGCLPIILINILFVYLIYGDYERNNYSFTDKSWFISNVDYTSYDANVTCDDSDYSTIRNQFQTCAPKYCFRYFTDFLISRDEAQILLNAANRQFSNKNESISILRVNNKNEIFSDKNELDTFKTVTNKILNLVQTKFGAQNVYLSKSIHFSKLTNNEPKSKEDEYWHSEIDKNYRANHYSSVLFLNDYMVEYNGGRFNFKNQNTKTILSIQPRLGRLMVYSPGSENEYYNERLLYGDRIALTFSLTCDKSSALTDQE